MSNETKRKYDAPRNGYKRWTCQVRQKLLDKFKAVAASERKNLIRALEEALENWVDTDDSDQAKGK